MDIVVYIIYAVAFGLVSRGVYGALPLVLERIRSRSPHVGPAGDATGHSRSDDPSSSRRQTESQLLDPSLPVFRPARPELTNAWDAPSLDNRPWEREPVAIHRPPPLDFDSKRQRRGHN